MFFCHCTDCRKATESPFAANVWFPQDQITFNTATPKAYTIKGSSGSLVHHGFCPDCGPPIGMWSEAHPSLRGLRAASFDHPSELTPSANVWTRSAIPWDKIDKDMKQFETQPSPEELKEIMTIEA